MLVYLQQRLALALPVVFGVSVVVFAIVHLLPGDPVLVMLSGANATPEQAAELRAQLRLDDPLMVQYLRFLRRAVVGDLGRSIFSKRPVIEEIASQLPSTLELAGAAIAIAVAVGLVLGILAALRPNSWLGLLLIFAFSLELGWLPATGQGGWQRLILPAATIGLGYAAVVARLVRSSFLEVLGHA